MIPLRAVIDAIIGKPFEIGARGPSSFDCLGVILWCYEYALGVTLPDPFHDRPQDYDEETAFKILGRSFLHVDDPQVFDVVYVSGENSPYGRPHVALVENVRQVVHVREGKVGVSREPLAPLLKIPCAELRRHKAFLCR